MVRSLSVSVKRVPLKTEDNRAHTLFAFSRTRLCQSRSRRHFRVPSTVPRQANRSDINRRSF